MILVYFGRVMFLGGKQPGLASRIAVPRLSVFKPSRQAAKRRPGAPWAPSGDLRYDPTVFNAGVTVVLACIAYVLSKDRRRSTRQ